jgi:tetratricopeptide (TPR) repeat protein/transcriptional regulator with XRE-family HTH domain
VKNPFQLADLLTQFIKRSGYTSGQLAKLSGVPKPTIVNWMEGRVRRPRTLNDLIRLTAVLHLTETEASQLLQSAGHPTIAELRLDLQQVPDEALAKLIDHWEVRPSTAVNHPAPFQAMAHLPYFVGRRELLEKLHTMLLAGDHATIYSIQGMGGVGKTALAAHLAYQLRSHFPDGVLWARVDTSDTMSILSTFASAYGLDVRQYGDLGSRSRIVRELLANKRVLIVLDNAQSSEQVKPLLPPTGACAVLVTTRRQDLAVMRGASRLMLGPFDPKGEESLLLFGQVLGDDRVAKERPLFVELANLLGHLPLAVDIAAGRLAYEPGWTTADFLRRLRQEQRRLLELESEDQSVRLSFNTSFQHLAEAQRQFFATLAIFSGDDFSSEAAAAVGNLSHDLAQDFLRKLYALSLMQAGRETAPTSPTENSRTRGQAIYQPNRYRLHLLLRDYAGEKLEDEMAVQQRLIHYFAEFVLTHSHDFAALDLEQKNVLTALQLAHDLRQTDDFVEGVLAIYLFWEAKGLYKVAADYLQKMETAVSTQTDPIIRLKFHHYRGRLAQRQGEYIEAEAQYEAALALARTLEAERQLSHVLRALGVLAARRGDYVLADSYYKEGLALAKALGHGGIVSNFLRGLGVQAYMRGDFARAEAFYEEGLTLIGMVDEKVPDAKGEGGMLWGLGVLAQEQGDLAQAQQYFEQSLALARQVGQQKRVILLLRMLAEIAVVQNLPKQAEAFWQEALLLAQDIGHRWQEARVLSEWGEYQIEVGQTAVAHETFQQLFRLARILQSQELVAVALFGLARETAVRGEIDLAKERGWESLDVFTAMGHIKMQEVKDWLMTVDG